MTWTTGTRRKRSAARGEVPAPAIPEHATAKRGESGDARKYAGAFARVRLVRAWVAAAAALVAVLSAYVTLLERLVK
jgi:hypothetical protein